MDHFTEIRNEYENCREMERKAIRDHLATLGFDVSKSCRAGKGIINYTSSGRIKPYDLRNWKFITASKDGKAVFISLQAFDQDGNSHNHHVLYDRIGIYTYEMYNAESAFIEMVTTDIDLPMNDEKFKRLDAAINEQMRRAV